MNFFKNAPKMLRINAHDFDIKIMPTDWRRNDGEVTTFGEYVEFEQEIRLRDDMKSESMAIEVMLHEIVHVIVHPLSLESQDEERLAQIIGLGLAQTFRDNPELIEWLGEDKENAEPCEKFPNLHQCQCSGSCPCKPEHPS